MTKIITKKTPPSKEKLCELHKNIWEEKYLRRPYGSKLKLMKAYDESRTLTTTEWEYIKEAVEALELPVVMTNTDYGFGVAIQIYDHPECPGAGSELLLAVSQKHFEENFNEGWDRFYSLIRTKRNLELIEFCKLPKLMKRSYYEY